MHDPCHFAYLESPLLQDIKEEISILKDGVVGIQDDTRQIKEISLKLRSLHIG